MSANLEFPSHRRSVLLMLGSVVFFSINALIIRGLSIHAGQVDGWLATLFRGAVGLGLMAVWFGGGRGLAWRSLLGRRLVVLRGAVGAVGIVAFYVTIVHLGAARATVLNLSYPMFAAIIAAVWLGEELGRRAALWIAIGFGGLLIFVGEGAFDAGVSYLDLVGLLGALAAGYVVVVIRRLRHSEHPATIYASQCLFSLLVAAPTSASAVPTLAWPPLAGLCVAALVVSIGQLMMTEAYRGLPVSQGSAIQMLAPLVTTTGGILIFHERFNALEAIGGAITLLATWQIVRQRNRQPSNPTTSPAAG